VFQFSYNGEGKEIGGGRRSPEVEEVEESSRAESDSSLIPGQVEAGFMGSLFG